MKLREVAEVRSGLVLSRKQAKDEPIAKYPLLNLRSIRADGTIDMREADVFPSKEILAPEYLTQIGDVVVRLSAPYTAVLIDESTKGMVISSYFVIIRTYGRKLLPEYLFWLLNTAKVKKHIFDNTTTNMLASINSGYFAEMEVPELPIADQKIIAELNMTALREANLLRSLAEQKATYYACMIEQAHDKMKRGNV